MEKDQHPIRKSDDSSQLLDDFDDSVLIQQSKSRKKRQAPYLIFPEILCIIDYDGYRLVLNNYRFLHMYPRVDQLRIFTVLYLFLDSGRQFYEESALKSVFMINQMRAWQNILFLALPPHVRWRISNILSVNI